MNLNILVILSKSDLPKQSSQSVLTWQAFTEEATDKSIVIIQTDAMETIIFVLCMHFKNRVLFIISFTPCTSPIHCLIKIY